MSETAPCSHCRRRSAGDPLDRRGWCGECRARVAGRAQLGGWVGVATVAFLYLGAARLLHLAPERWIVAWAALGGLLCFAAFKISRRVAFEVIQARATPLPPDSYD